jgi:hypothetical protein
MRFLLLCVVAGVAVGAGIWFVRGESGRSGEEADLEKALTTYLEGRLAEAEEVFKELRESGAAPLSEVLAAEDRIDRLKLHLRLLREARLINDHPIFSELRREFGVPEIPESGRAKRSEAVVAGIRDYIQKKLERAEKECERAKALLEAGRAADSDLRAAVDKREGLKLLLQAERRIPRAGAR